MSFALFNRFVSSKKSLLFSILIAIVLGMFFIAAWRANTDLTEGRFALFMDEKITFDGVRKILHPESIKSFLQAIIDGGDQRYGRSLWNSIALFAFIPEKIWGEKGQIVATRMFQVLLLYAAF